MRFQISTERNRQTVIDYIRKLPQGKEYDVQIIRHKETRSMDANRLYWLWLKVIAEDTGHDKDEIHEEFKSRFVGTETIRGFYGFTAVRPVSTAKLDTAQFSQYMERVKVFASAGLGIVLPVPGDMAFESMIEQYEDRI